MPAPHNQALTNLISLNALKKHYKYHPCWPGQEYIKCIQAILEIGNSTYVLKRSKIGCHDLRALYVYSSPSNFRNFQRQRFLACSHLDNLVLFEAISQLAVFEGFQESALSSADIPLDAQRHWTVQYAWKSHPPEAVRTQVCRCRGLRSSAGHIPILHRAIS